MMKDRMERAAETRTKSSWKQSKCKQASPQERLLPMQPQQQRKTPTARQMLQQRLVQLLQRLAPALDLQRQQVVLLVPATPLQKVI